MFAVLLARGMKRALGSGRPRARLAETFAAGPTMTREDRLGHGNSRGIRGRFGPGLGP